jgi:creatinine amidohydrolase
MQLFFCLLAACFALAAPAVVAQNEPPTRFLEEMTWPEVRAAIDSGNKTVLIPTGGTEQNGPQMVLGKHNFIVRETSTKIAETLGNALIAPVMAYVPEGVISPPSGHMRFAGTISLSEATFEAVLEETARSLKQHGFNLICFIGDSGGNQAAQERIAQKLSLEWKHENVRVLAVTDYYSKANGQDDWLLSQGFTKEEVEGHAALSDTSELMAVNPFLVRSGELKDRVPEDEPKLGVTASSKHASSEIGYKLLPMKIAAAVKQIQSSGGGSD